MNNRKYKNAMAVYKGHNGPVTMDAVMAQIPEDLIERLTGAELGAVMSAVNAAYHNGRSSLQGMDVIDDCVWLPWGGGVKTECSPCQTSDPAKCSCAPKHKIGTEQGQLIPIDALRSIKIIDGLSPTGYTKGLRYTMDHIEGHW